MSLAASLDKFKTERAEAASRNAQYARPSSTAPARTSTPKPGDNKRSFESAFASVPSSSSQSAITSDATGGGYAGGELLTQVWNSVKYLKEKDLRPVAFEDLVGYLSLPVDAQKNIPYIRTALQKHERVEYISKAASGNGKEAFRYRPLHPVSNAEELKAYLERQPTAQGVSVRELKDGWPDCIPTIDRLEREGYVLVIRNKKDNSPKTVWTDSPTYHILNPVTTVPQKADADFADLWAKTKLPATEMELRLDLEKAGLTPTSQVKEMRKAEPRSKEKRRVNRKGGKTTNAHMIGILKDYSRR